MEDMVRIFPRATSERRASLYAFMKGALTGTIFSFILLGIVYLLASQLVDWSLIVSLWIAELLLATFFYFLFGDREQSARSRTIDAIEKDDAVLHYHHL